MTNEKEPIDPTKPQQTRTSNTRWDDIRQTLTPGSRTSSPNNSIKKSQNNAEYQNNDEVDEDRRSLLATGIVAGAIGLGVGAVGAGLYADRDDDIEGPGIIEDDDPDPAPEEEPEAATEPIDRYMNAAEYETIPGPDAGEGYNVEERLLREYNEIAWEEMAVEEEYEELGTGSEFYLQEDGTVVGVNEREQRSRIFPPEEFPQNEEYSDLYEELEERN